MYHKIPYNLQNLTMAKVKLISHFHSNSLGLLLLQNYDRPTFVKGGGHGYAATWTETEEGTKWTNNSSSLVPLETPAIPASMNCWFFVIVAVAAASWGQLLL